MLHFDIQRVAANQPVSLVRSAEYHRLRRTSTPNLLTGHPTRPAFRGGKGTYVPRELARRRTPVMTRGRRNAWQRGQPGVTCTAERGVTA